MLCKLTHFFLFFSCNNSLFSTMIFFDIFDGFSIFFEYFCGCKDVLCNKLHQDVFGGISGLRVV